MKDGDAKMNQSKNKSIHFSADHSGLPIASVIQLAWAKVLSVHFNQKDVTFGLVMSNRADGFDNIMGPCISTNPCRINFNNLQKNVEILEEIQKNNGAILSLPEMGLRAILDTVGPNFDINSLLTITDATKDKQTFYSSLEVSEMIQNYPLSVIVTLSSGVTLSMDYDASLTDEAAEILLDHFKNAILYCLKYPDYSVENICLLSPYEQELLHKGFADEPRIEIVHRSLIDLFQETVKSYPEKTAIKVLGQGSLTYSQLSKLADKFATYLQSKGVNYSSIIPVSFPKSQEMIIAILALYKLGAAYCPIDPNVPKDRQLAMIKELGATYVVCHPDFASIFSSDAIVLSYDPKHGTTDRSLVKNGQNKIAYVIFTSGSTGKPKGVFISQEGAVHSCVYHAEIYGDHNVLQFSNYAFDISVTDIFSTFYSTGCLCIATRDSLLNDLNQVMVDMDIEMLYTTNTVASLIVPEKATSLKILAVGGEKVSQGLVNRWADRVDLYNLCGN